MLLGKLNLLLLLHLDLDIGYRGWNLAIDHKIRGWGRRLSYFILAYNFNASIIGAYASHHRGLSIIAKHLSLLRKVYGPNMVVSRS